LKPLEISYDAQRDLLTVDGVVYSGEIFRSFALGNMDREWFRITGRSEYDGQKALTIEKMS
jgi:hypothetical protein